MRIAVAGKGGAGKTTLTATMARLTARSGREVVCIDADSNPNLAAAIGVDRHLELPTLPASIVSRRLDGPALLAPVADVLAAHTVAAPDGIRLTTMGAPDHAEEGCLCSAHAVVRATLADLGRGDRFVLLDLEASPEHFSRGTARHVDVMLLVAEPYFRSLETVRRMAALAAGLPIARLAVVGNKVRDERDAQAIAEFCDRHELELLGSAPFDPAVLDADRDRRPVVDVHADGPYVSAVADVLTQLRRNGGAGTAGAAAAVDGSS